MMKTLGMPSQPVDLNLAMKFRTLMTSACLTCLSLSTMAADAPRQDNGSSLTLGVGVGRAPRFLGSKESQTGAFPVFDYQHQSGFFVGSRRGLGWAGGDDVLKYSFALGARERRDEKDHSLLGTGTGGKELEGMGDVKASALGMMGVGIQLGKQFGVNAALEVPLTQRNNGAAFHLGASYTLLKTSQDTVSLGAKLSYGDDKYLRTYFGVTAQQSQKSGYALFTPKAGFFKTDLTLTWSHQIDEHWGVTTMAGASRLMGDASDSPLARRKTSPQGGVLLSYTF